MRHLGIRKAGTLLLTLTFCTISHIASAFPDTLWINSLSSATLSSSIMQTGTLYEVEATGSFSIWSASNWAQGSCGDWEPTPMFPSGSNSRVGRDPVFRYGEPTCCASCASAANPGGHSNIRYSIDGSAAGIGFGSIGSFTYSPSHSYTGTVTGQGQPLLIRFFDGFNSDNSGRIRVVVRALPVAPVPTMSQWGMIVLALLVLCIGAAAVWRRSFKYA
jgi:hypothetical protein